jgi:hypothetical protein
MPVPVPITIARTKVFATSSAARCLSDNILILLKRTIIAQIFCLSTGVVKIQHLGIME